MELGLYKFDFNFITDTELIFDMLGATHASEHATPYHNAHLC